MMTIIATCGHDVEHISHLWDCTLAEYDRKNKRCLSYVSYCKECYDQAVLDGIVLFDQGEENKWLGGNDE